MTLSSVYFKCLRKVRHLTHRGVAFSAELLTQMYRRQSFTEPCLSVPSTTAHFLPSVKLHNRLRQELLLKRQEKEKREKKKENKKPWYKIYAEFVFQ